jgi:hypothetical protein
MKIVENLPKTRHLYILQDGEVIVLEHVVTIHNSYPAGANGRFFQVDMIGGTTHSHPDVANERAELIKALAAI